MQIVKKSNVLLVSSGGLGDAMLFSLMIPYYKKLLKSNEHLTVLCRSGAEAVQFLFPSDVDFVTVDYRRFIRDIFYRYKICRQLRQRQFRVAISTDHLRLPTVDDKLIFATRALEKYAMIPRTWPKHDEALEKNKKNYTRLIPVTTDRAHRIVRWTELINELLGENRSLPTVRFSEVIKNPRILDQPTIVLHPFSSVKERQCSVSLFQDILKKIPSDYAVVLSSGPGDLEKNPDYKVLLNDTRVRVDESSIESKAALYAAATCVFAVDTSMLHLAIGVGAQTIGLLSAAHLLESVPYDPRTTPDNVTFIYKSMPCAGCLGACIYPLQQGRYRCVDELTIDKINIGSNLAYTDRSVSH